MRTFMKLVLVVMIASSFAYGQTRKSPNTSVHNTELEIERLEQQRLNAYLNLDFVALERIMSDDYTSVYADGQEVTKPREIESIRSFPVAILSSPSPRII